MKSISVVIPLYNQGCFLKDSIQSLFNQTHREWEAIIINDGSTDDSGEVADRYALSDSRIKVFHQRNGGVASARNSGLRYSTGEYVALLDSDDYYRPNFFDAMLRRMVSDSSIDLVWTKPQNVDKNLRIIPPFYKNFGGIANYYSQQLLNTKPAYRLVWNNPSVPCGELWRGSTIRSLMFSEERELSSNEDWDLLCRLEKIGGRFSYNDGTFSFYRKHGSSANNNYVQMKSSFLHCAIKNYASSTDSWIAALSRLALTLSLSQQDCDESTILTIPGDSREDQDTIDKILNDHLVLPFASIWCGGAIRRASKNPPLRSVAAISYLKKRLPTKIVFWHNALHRLLEKFEDCIHQGR